MSATKRGTASKQTRKIPVLCQYGPLEGHTLYLQHYKATAVFTLLNQRGRYINGKWHAA